MCDSKYIQYTCGCKKETEFVQCDDRLGTNVRCHPLKKVLAKRAENFCSGHLVNPDAKVKSTG